MNANDTFKILSIERTCNSCKYGADGLDGDTPIYAPGMKYCTRTGKSHMGWGYNCREENFRDWELE